MNKQTALLLIVVLFTHILIFNDTLAAESSLTQTKLGVTYKNIEIPSELLIRKSKKRDPHCALSVDSALRALTIKEKTVIIDVRNKEEFEKFRIPGSLNIPLFAIKTKGFLKSKHLILINEGYDYTYIEEECRNLKKAGFTVSVVDGGLYLWKQKNGPLMGDLFAQRELNKIPVYVFHREKDYENWLFIDVAEEQNLEDKTILPDLIHIPYSGDRKTFLSQLSNRLDEHKNTGFLSIMICNENGNHYEQIEKLVKDAEIDNVYFLKGGLEGYKMFLVKQSVILQEKENNNKKKIKGCSRCP